jgi:hypothetical protein
VVVTDLGEPVSDVAVLVSASDGSAVMVTSTDARGTALVEIPDGGMVSVLRKFSTVSSGRTLTLRAVESAQGVADGDTFRVHAWGDPGAEPQAMVVTLGYDTTMPGAELHEARVVCGQSVVNFLGPFARGIETQGCPWGAPYDVYLFAKDSAGERIGYDYLFDQPFMAGGVATHILTPTKTDFATATLMLSDLPENVGEVLMLTQGRRAGAEGYIWDADTWYWPVGSATSSLLLPARALSEFVSMARFWLGSPGVTVTFVEVEDGLPPSASWSANSFAWIEDLEPVDVSDLERPVVRWSLSAEGSREGMMWIEQHWVPGINQASWWRLARRAVDSGEAQFPVLPDELAEFAPGAGSVAGYTGVMHDDIVEIMDDFGYVTDHPSPAPLAGHDYRHADTFY